ARELVGCKYAALGVLGDDGYIARFPTSGISKTDREKLGAPPRGHGLLGVMLRAGRSLRIPDISKDPRRVGFPPHHPPMTTLLGVPIFVQGKLVGDLYLTDKQNPKSQAQISPDQVSDLDIEPAPLNSHTSLRPTRPDSPPPPPRP